MKLAMNQAGKFLYYQKSSKLMINRKQVLVVALLISFLISPLLRPAQAENVDILNPMVNPSTIRVGDTFAINATIVNNSNETISVQNSCSGAFSAEFDSHVSVGLAKVCNWMPIQIILEPGKNITSSSLSSNLGYTATSPGIANATLTISYKIANKTSPNLSFEPNPINVSKSFQFTVLEKPVPQPPAALLPLQQVRSGTAAMDVKCKDGLQLVLKAEDGSPACVRSSTAIQLMNIGWSKN